MFRAWRVAVHAAWGIGRQGNKIKLVDLKFSQYQYQYRMENKPNWDYFRIVCAIANSTGRHEPRILRFLIRTSQSVFPLKADPLQQPSFTGKPKKKRKPRTCFSVGQMLVLENTFQQTKYVSITDRGKLAGSLGLTDSQIKVRNRYYYYYTVIPRYPVPSVYRAWNPWDYYSFKCLNVVFFCTSRGSI